MTTEQILSFHSEAAENGFKGCFIWGGEPLLRKDIKEILEHDRKLGWWVTMATNGTFLKNRAEIVANNVNELLVSVDIPSEEHDKIRGQSGTFRRCVEGIRAVKAINPRCRIKICTVISNLNKHAIKSLAEFAKKEKCQLNLQHIDRNLQRNPGMMKVEISMEKKKEINKEIIALKKQGYPIMNSYTYLKQYQNGKNPYSCRSQFMYFTVWPNGDVNSCSNGSNLGNVLKSSVKEIIDSDIYQAHLNSSSKCTKCMDSGTWETTHIYSLRPEALVNFMKNLTVKY